MTKISIPIPTSPIGYVTIDGKKLPVEAPREWYRYWGLLFEAVGGDTGGIEDVALLSAGGQLSEGLSVIADLQQRIANLESQRRDEPLSLRDFSDVQLSASREETGEIARNLRSYGTMALQNANAVAITGGAISGLTSFGAVTQTQNAISTVTIVNANGGGSAESRITVSNGTSTGFIAIAGTAYGGYGAYVASSTVFYTASAAGLVAMADNAAGVFIICTGGNSERLRVDAGGVLQVQSPSIIANNTVATVLGSVGPTGSHTTVQEWLQFKNSSGTMRYVPAF